MPRKALSTTVANQIQHTASQDVTNASGLNVYEDHPIKEPLTPHSYIAVRNGFNGKLVYKSSRTGERFIWESFGDEQEMELQELKSAKNSSKVFFENNWFLIDDPDVIAYLGVGQYYRTSLTYDGIEELFNMTPDVIREKIRQMPDGQRQTIAYLAKQMVDEGKIDSMRVINTLESSLKIKLNEQ